MILDVTLEMLRNLSFTRRNLVNFFVKNLHFFFTKYLFQIYCIFYHWSDCSSTWFAAILDMPIHHMEIWARRSCFPCHAASGGDRNNCGARNIIGVQLGIIGEREIFVVFTRMNLFLEEM